MTEKRQRVTDILNDYWEELRGNKAYPSIDEIDKNKLAEVWEDTFLIEVFPLVMGSGYRFLHKGKNIGDDYHSEAGKYIKNLVIGFLDNASDRYEKVIKEQKPLREENIFETDNTKLKYRQILLPLGNSDKGEITGIIGGMRFLKEVK